MNKLLLILLLVPSLCFAGTPDYTSNPVSTAKVPINQGGAYYHTTIGDILQDIADARYATTAHTHSTLPTADQDAALDAASAPSALNPFATIGDISAAGGGDMMEAEYATNGNVGVVDSAEKVSGVDTAGNSEYYGKDETGAVGFHYKPSAWVFVDDPKYGASADGTAHLVSATYTLAEAQAKWPQGGLDFGPLTQGDGSGSDINILSTDTVALRQAAYDAGQELLPLSLGSNLYYLTGKLRLPAHIPVFGKGKGVLVGGVQQHVTTITGNYDGPFIEVYGAGNVIQDLAVAPDGTPGANQIGIVLGSDITGPQFWAQVRHCRFTNNRVAVKSVSLVFGGLERNLFRGNYLSLLVDNTFDADRGDCYVSGNEFSDSIGGNTQVTIRQGSGWRINNNKFLAGATQLKIDIPADTNNFASAYLIENNSFENSTGTPIVITSADTDYIFRVLFVGNEIYNIVQADVVDISHVDEFIWADNTVRSYSAVGTSALKLRDVKHFNVSGGTLLLANYGLNVDSTVTKGVVNLPYSNSTVAIQGTFGPDVTVAGTGTDNEAIHDNVAGEINAIASKATPASTDVLLIEDSAAGYVKKKITVGSLPTGSGGEVNTASNSATGTGTGLIFKEKSGDDLVFKRILAGNGVTVTNGTDDIIIEAASGSSTTFAALTDTPSSYSGQVGKYVKVNATADGLEFSSGTSGGSISLASPDYFTAYNASYSIPWPGLTDCSATTTLGRACFDADDKRIYLGGGSDGALLVGGKGTGGSLLTTTTIAASGTASDAKVPTEKAVRDAMGSSTSISQGDSNVEAIDAGAGQIDFDVDGTNLLQIRKTTGGTNHAILHVGADSTRMSISAGDGIVNKTPKLSLIPDNDATLAVRGGAFFDYGSDDVDLLSTTSPYFSLRNINNGTITNMLMAWADDGLMVQAKDITEDISDTDLLPVMMTISQDQASNTLIFRWKEADGTLHTATITADP